MYAAVAVIAYFQIQLDYVHSIPFEELSLNFMGDRIET